MKNKLISWNLYSNCIFKPDPSSSYVSEQLKLSKTYIISTKLERKTPPHNIFIEIRVTTILLEVICTYVPTCFMKIVVLHKLNSAQIDFLTLLILTKVSN